MNKYPPAWKNEQSVRGIRYTCGYCGTDTSPSFGWYSDAYSLDQQYQGYVLICTNCNRPSFVDVTAGDRQVVSVTPAINMTALKTLFFMLLVPGLDGLSRTMNRPATAWLASAAKRRS